MPIPALTDTGLLPLGVLHFEPAAAGREPHSRGPNLHPNAGVRSRFVQALRLCKDRYALLPAFRKAAEDSRTPRPGERLVPHDSRKRLGVRLSSAAFLIGW